VTRMYYRYSLYYVLAIVAIVLLILWLAGAL
jgi:hypothetical protein